MAHADTALFQRLWSVDGVEERRFCRNLTLALLDGRAVGRAEGTHNLMLLRVLLCNAVAEDEGAMLTSVVKLAQEIIHVGVKLLTSLLHECGVRPDIVIIATAALA